ncbi:MAG: outer membrane protein assembly factor BamD [Acidobacteria bacterium]|nr:outer membrane protein assembly factor BamD [Acidobacteriota bacterium]MBK9708030.1 outer membrane protein assembly factor BamD [Acidobacteriota bacterium]
MRCRVSVYALSVAILALAVGLSGCGSKDKVKNENAPIPGRDKEIYEQASVKARKGRYDESRLLYNVVISTYPDSEYLPLAKLAIADSFYLEGGTSNLEQAIGGYKDFAQYFPTHPRICDVKHKIAHSLMRQMGAYNRDASKARQAEFQLKAALQSCQMSAFKPQIESDLKDVQQALGLHELDIARFYINNRQAYKAGESRLRDIIVQYPFFSYYDESLYLLGVTLIEQEQPEEASEYFTKLVRDYPNSEFSKKGRDYLEKLGKPLPTPSNNDPAPVRPGYMGKFGLILGNNGLDISRDGVLLSKEGTEKDEVKGLAKPSDASGATGTRAIRASTRQNVDAPAVSQSAPAAAAQTPAQTTPAADNKSDSKNKKEKPPKKKKGILGIFK